MKKKLLSLVMATAMILSLAVPAFAAGTNYWGAGDVVETGTATLTFPARMFTPTIKLTMPKIESNPVVLNPYKLDYKVIQGNSATADLKLNNVTIDVAADQVKQVISPIYAIKNETNVKLNFQVSTTTTKTGDIILTNDHVDLDATTKQAFIQLVIKKDATDSAPAIANNAAMDNLDAYDEANNETLTLLDTGNVATDTAIPKSLAVPTTPSNGAANYLQFQFTGELARTPSTAWVAADTISSQLTFTFTPVGKPDFTGVFTAPTSNVSASTPGPVTLTLPKYSSTAASGYTAEGLNSATDTALTAAKFSLHATNPDWSVLDGGTLKATAGEGSDAGKLVIPATETAKLDKGASITNTVLLGFRDKNNVPRTIETTVEITRAS